MGPADLAIVGLIVVSVITYYLYRRQKEVTLSRKISQASRCKLKTMEFLEDKGYKILDWDSSIEITSIIDNKTYTDVAAVDFIVEKGNRRYLVKTASGGQSSRLGYRENREPLTALTCIFSCPNLLLVDTDRGNIRVMETSAGRGLASGIEGLVRSVPVFLSGVLCAAILWYVRHLVN